MLDTIQVSHEQLFYLFCQLDFSLVDFRARAQTAMQYGDKFAYWAAKEDYDSTLKMLTSPVFSMWNTHVNKEIFPTWADYMTNCDDTGTMVVFSDGSTIDDTVDVPF